MSAAEQLPQETIQVQEVRTVTLRVVPANPDHFKGEATGSLKFGVLYFLKSEVTGQLENQPYYTGPHTNIFEFRAWFRKKMVYEPISPNDAVLFGYDEKIENKTNQLQE